MRNTFSWLFISTGIICFVISGALFWQRNNPNRIRFETESFNVSAGRGEPAGERVVALEIKSSGIYAPVINANSVDKKWEVTDKGISLLTDSPIPGEKGNSILYGHNWKSILANLPKTNIGDTITIYFESGSEKHFVVNNIEVVEPADLRVLESSSDARITLYTCTGFLDSKRFVVTASLEDQVDELSSSQ
jgi:LPXTG-site transpeptidase (sortase) family protein